MLRQLQERIYTFAIQLIIWRRFIYLFASLHIPFCFLLLPGLLRVVPITILITLEINHHGGMLCRMG